MPNPDRPTGPENLPERIAIFPLRGAILLPGGRLPLNIFEPRYLAMTRDAMSGGRMIGMIQPRETDEETYTPPIYGVGCLGRITEFAETGDGRYQIAISGVCRFRVQEEVASDTAYRQVIADYAGYPEDFGEEDAPGRGVDRQRLVRGLQTFLDRQGLKADWEAAERASDVALINSLSMMLPLDPSEKQALLEADNVPMRAEILTTLIEMSLLSGDGDSPVQ
ncbi:MAG: LON peptidase substrate-binding domain-containing protein [Minwuia sp.]|nr:LON peptidase substrate-binding domain-containing protein [Minwuia sp.]